MELQRNETKNEIKNQSTEHMETKACIHDGNLTTKPISNWCLAELKQDYTIKKQINSPSSVQVMQTYIHINSLDRFRNFKLYVM